MFLENQIKDLVDSIKETNEFKEFNKARVHIDKYRNLKDEIQEFEKKQIELSNIDMQSKEGQSLAFELNRSFKKLSQFPEVHKLLNSAKAFNDMMFKIYKAIQDSLDSEFDKDK